jgi:hypothetical protein
MARQADSRGPEQVRAEIEAERNQLARAVDELRDGVADATNVGAKLSAKLPLAAGAAAAAGFFLAGGVGATFRYLARRGREGDEQARAGRFSIIRRG